MRGTRRQTGEAARARGTELAGGEVNRAGGAPGHSLLLGPGAGEREEPARPGAGPGLPRRLTPPRLRPPHTGAGGEGAAVLQPGRVGGGGGCSLGLRFGVGWLGGALEAGGRPPVAGTALWRPLQLAAGTSVRTVPVFSHLVFLPVGWAVSPRGGSACAVGFSSGFVFVAVRFSPRRGELCGGGGPGAAGRGRPGLGWGRGRR